MHTRRVKRRSEPSQDKSHNERLGEFSTIISHFPQLWKVQNIELNWNPLCPCIIKVHSWSTKQFLWGDDGCPMHMGQRPDLTWLDTPNLTWAMAMAMVAIVLKVKQAAMETTREANTFKRELLDNMRRGLGAADMTCSPIWRHTAARGAFRCARSST